ncbi:MAG: hypothetical protein FWH18_11995 [Marinilabiliaceae bacterium]|nr:hypothetical protein [Marinilabiliaceae bacterium]
MNLPIYELDVGECFTTFEFISHGQKGKIPKIITFTEMMPFVYNLGFGDKNSETGEMDDLAISNNGDTEKVLATVVSAVYAFTKDNPENRVYAIGSTNARNRLYRIGISKHYDDAIKDFDIFGLRNGVWVNFEKNVDYSAFIVKRKL